MNIPTFETGTEFWKGTKMFAKDTRRDIPQTKYNLFVVELAVRAPFHFTRRAGLGKE